MIKYYSFWKHLFLKKSPTFTKILQFLPYVLMRWDWDWAQLLPQSNPTHCYFVNCKKYLSSLSSRTCRSSCCACVVSGFTTQMHRQTKKCFKFQNKPEAESQKKLLIFPLKKINPFHTHKLAEIIHTLACSPLKTATFFLFHHKTNHIT